MCITELYYFLWSRCATRRRPPIEIIPLYTFIAILLLSVLVKGQCPDPEDCTGEAPDDCGFLPSTYGDLGLGGQPAACDAECTLDGGFDKCGVCGGDAEFLPHILLEPVALEDGARLGGSVANWNGSVAAAQHAAQEWTPMVNVPVVTWTADHTVCPITHELYTLPSMEGDLEDEEAAVPVGLGHALQMSEDHLVIGSHDSHPRLLQLWVRSPSPPWSWVWSANDPCPGNRFGFSVAIDDRLPQDDDDGVRGSVIAGDPAAFFSGRVYIYFTYSPGIYQTLFHGMENNTALDCFGHSVGADNGLLAVGAPALDFGGFTDSGSVYVYRWNVALGPDGEYELVTQITPPAPADNLGFGQDVAVYDDRVVIGDNQGEVYHYLIVGLLAIQVTHEQPSGINLASRLGYTVSIWDEYIIAGDENFIPSPTPRGATFVWNDNPLTAFSYRLMYTLTDAEDSVQTRFGANVDVRGGCFVASGATNHPNHGGVFLTNLCRDNCFGCDNVLNSCVRNDECGVCGGDNSTCTDCNGVLFGDDIEDACGVCEGDNTTCVNPFAEPAFILTPCETPFQVTLRHEFEEQHGPAEWVLVAPFPTGGSVLIENSGSLMPLPTLTYTPDPFESGADSISVEATIISTNAVETLVIPVLVGTCLDCFGVPNGPARPDECGVCDGDNSTCLDCFGVPNGGAVEDYCGVCDGDNSTCLDIITDPVHIVDCAAHFVFDVDHEPASVPVTWMITVPPDHGMAFINAMTGVVLYQNDGTVVADQFTVKATSTLNPAIMDSFVLMFTVLPCEDCDGVQGGLQIVDACGVCGGDSTSCQDCAGVPNGGAVLDVCGVCDGDGTTCEDCLGVPNGAAMLDECGVCEGDGSTCGGSGTPISVVVILVVTFTVLGLLLLCVLFTLFRLIWRRRNLSSMHMEPVIPNKPYDVTYQRNPAVNTFPTEIVEGNGLVSNGASRLNAQNMDWSEYLGGKGKPLDPVNSRQTVIDPNERTPVPYKLQDGVPKYYITEQIKGEESQDLNFKLPLNGEQK